MKAPSGSGIPPHMRTNHLFPPTQHRWFKQWRKRLRTGKAYADWPTQLQSQATHSHCSGSQESGYAGGKTGIWKGHRRIYTFGIQFSIYKFLTCLFPMCFPRWQGAKQLGPGSMPGSSPGSEYKSDPQGRNIRSWGHLLVSVSPTVFLPIFRIRGKGLLFTYPLRPQRVPSLIHLGLLAQSWVHINKYIIINKHRRVNEWIL